MRPTMRPEGVRERLALHLNLAPTPIVEAMFGMATARVVMAGMRLGLYARLAGGPTDAATIANDCHLDPAGTRHLLDCLTALGHLDHNSSERHPDPIRQDILYTLKPRLRRWLDPASPTYVGDFLLFNYDQWEWWSRLEEAVQTGRPADIHAFEPDDPRWRRYITAMYQLARLSAPEVVRRLRLSPYPGRLLDMAGGHGGFAAAFCRRYSSLRATVLDLPGSAQVGREIMAEAGMSERVAFVEGDILTCDPGGPFDVILCFQILHHLTPDQNTALFRRARAALAPGGTLAVLDYFATSDGSRPDSGAFLGMHFYLTSAAAVYREAELLEWLRTAGFPAPRRIPLRRLPVQTLYEATRSPR